MPPLDPSLPHRTFLVEAEHDGLRLDLFLAARIPRLSRSKAARICRAAVWLEPARPVKPSLRVRAGDRVHLRRKDDSTDTPAPIPTVAYQDPRLIILNKPPGLLIHPTARHYSNTLSEMIKRGDVAGCPPQAAPVHRLDRETSGLLMLGADGDAIATLRDMFAGEGTRLTKLYWAIVADPARRWPPGELARLDTPLGFAEGARVKIAMGRGALPAVTHVEAMGRRGELAWLACRIETGRQHQIRVHLAMEGTPVVGDKLYQLGEEFFMRWSAEPGAPELTGRLPHPRHMLHAARLTWVCPWSGQTREVTSPWPEDFPDVAP